MDLVAGLLAADAGHVVGPGSVAVLAAVPVIVDLGTAAALAAAPCNHCFLPILSAGVFDAAAGVAVSSSHWPALHFGSSGCSLNLC